MPRCKGATPIILKLISLGEPLTADKEKIYLFLLVRKSLPL
jgi:hypothetical protein